MGLYTKCADPAESAARREWMESAEQQGEMEETAMQMVRAAISAEPVIVQERTSPPTSERVPKQQDKKKLGRPPGKRTVQQSPRLIQGSNSRKRKVQKVSLPTCRRRLLAEGSDPRSSKNSDGPSDATTTSENQPICNMIQKKP
ncbi:unnamed protein product, partial [Eruca vesicaria subsp. sativa]|nr:unnamed protein product [Eruca vesicaria subsp. sativa]